MKKNIYTIVLLVFILDQVVKNIVSTTIELGNKLVIIPNFLNITYVKNTGGAWSILSNYPFILTLISFLFLIGLNYYINNKNTYTKLEVIYLGIIIGGVLGNFIDRIIYNGVIDYISFKFGSYYYPVFNIADIMIVVGVILIMIEMIRGGIFENRNKGK